MAPEGSETFGDRSVCADALREPVQPLFQSFLLGTEAHFEPPDLGRPECCSIRGEVDRELVHKPGRHIGLPFGRLCDVFQFIIAVNPASPIFHSIPAAEHFSHNFLSYSKCLLQSLNETVSEFRFAPSAISCRRW
jgi:hypothetical protein